MCWKPKNNIDMPIEIKLPPPPSKKEFRNMFELLKDAEKYDTADEIGISVSILENLVSYAQDYISIKRQKIHE